MYTSRTSKILITLFVLFAALTTISFVARSNNTPSVDRTYDSIEQLRVIRTSTSHDDQIEQVRLARFLDALTDRSYDDIEGLRNLRAGVVSAPDFGYDLIEQVRLERSYTADRSYDKIEALRLGR